MATTEKAVNNRYIYFPSNFTENKIQTIQLIENCHNERRQWLRWRQGMKEKRLNIQMIACNLNETLYFCSHFIENEAKRNTFLQRAKRPTTMSSMTIKCSITTTLCLTRLYHFVIHSLAVFSLECLCWMPVDCSRQGPSRDHFQNTVAFSFRKSHAGGWLVAKSHNSRVARFYCFDFIRFSFTTPNANILYYYCCCCRRT